MHHHLQPPALERRLRLPGLGLQLPGLGLPGLGVHMMLPPSHRRHGLPPLGPLQFQNASMLLRIHLVKRPLVVVQLVIALAEAQAILWCTNRHTHTHTHLLCCC